LFGIGLPEFLVILAVAVVVIGPKDLPRALYAAGKLMRKFRMFTADIQKSLDHIMHEGELDDIIREANKPGGADLQQKIEAQVQLENKNKEDETRI
jgi:sec-independent protein translocase protein TatB